MQIDFQRQSLARYCGISVDSVQNRRRTNNVWNYSLPEYAWALVHTGVRRAFLQQSGRAKISISTQLPRSELMDSNALLLEAIELGSGRKRTILIDLSDSPRFSVSPSVSWFDVIVKRSFGGRWIDELPNELKQKVIPYGINFNCNSHTVPILQIFAKHHLMRLKLFRKQKTRKIKFWWQHQLRFLFYLTKSNLSLYEEDFEGTPDGRTKYSIFFVTRLFEDLANPGELRQFSQERIQLVKALRQEFGARFHGGVIENRLAKRHCPKTLLRPKISRREFTKTLRESDILVFTLGVMKSNPWKLGEAVAGARCIVSEPLFYELPTPLEEGVHIKTFVTVEDCLRACEELIRKPGLIREMKENVWAYYQKHVKAEQLIGRIISEAFYNE